MGQRRWKKWLALKLGRKAMLDGATFIHALNEEEARLPQRLGIHTPSVVLPNGVFIEEVAKLPPSTAIHAQFPQLRGRPYILFLGRLHYTKGLDVLAEAFAMFTAHNKEVDLVIVGPDGGARREFEEQVVESGVAHRVHMLGPLYGPAKYAAIAGAICLCLPSRQEGFSMAITEAMACGLPVVISKSCHFPEVEHAGAGAIVDLDPRQIDDALRHMIDDTSHRTQAGRAARTLILDSYTWPTIAQGAIEAYRRALNPDES